MNKNSPNTFLVGVQKAGTSSLYDWLSQHPEIFAPKVMKDLHVFSSDEYYPKRKEIIEKNYADASASKIILKGGVNYIFHPHVAERIYKFNPETKIIIVLRDPVERAISAYKYFKNLTIETRSFETAIKEESLLNDEKEKASFAYAEHGLYHNQIQRYFSLFDSKNIKILFFEEMISNPKEIYNDVCEFLRINSFNPNFDLINNSNEPKYKWINQITFGNNKIAQSLKNISKSFLSLEQRNSISKFIRDKNKNEVKSKKLLVEKELLKGYYKEDVEQLSQLLGRDLFKIWKSV